MTETKRCGGRLCNLLFCEIKVKLSPCLTKYHDMKTYYSLIKHNVMKEYWGSGRIASVILTLGTR